MIKKLSQVLVNNDIINENDLDIYEYGIFIVLFNVLCLGTIIFLGIILNKFIFTLQYLLFYLPNRMIIGGFHCKSPQKCFLTFCISYLFILVVSNIVPYNDVLYIISVMVYIILIYIHLKRKNDFKIILLVCCSSFLFLSLCLEITRIPYIYACFFNCILFFGGII